MTVHAPILVAHAAEYHGFLEVVQIAAVYTHSSSESQVCRVHLSVHGVAVDVLLGDEIGRRLEAIPLALLVLDEYFKVQILPFVVFEQITPASLRDIDDTVVTEDFNCLALLGGYPGTEGDTGLLDKKIQRSDVRRDGRPAIIGEYSSFAIYSVKLLDRLPCL